MQRHVYGYTLTLNTYDPTEFIVGRVGPALIVKVVTPDRAEGPQYFVLPSDDPLRAVNILREAAGLPPSPR